MRPSEVLEIKREGVLSIFAKYEEFGITEPKVFGSVAKGTDTEASDIDFLITVDNEAEGISYIKIAELLEEITDFLGVSCDLVMKHCIKEKYFKKRVLTEAKDI